ncbi:hypothetical protein M569_06068, partial [Genlisea aurea]
QTIFDITKFGAKPGADIRQALLSAWDAAAKSSTPSKVVVPAGNWYLSQILLQENKAPIELNVQGTIEADADPGKLPNKQAEWITINYVDGLTLTGGGVFDGKGQQAWKQNDCGSNTECAKLPIVSETI